MIEPDPPAGSGESAPTADPHFGYRLRFRKEGTARFLSHHDLLRTFERALRRSGAPISFTAGMNPHPRMSVRPALALGASALDAAFDLVLSEQMDETLLGETLNSTAPAGLVVFSATPTLGRRPWPITAVSWNFDLPHPEGDAEGRLSETIPGAKVAIGEAGVTVTLAATPDREPPGPRAIARCLWPGLDPASAAGAAVLATCIFADEA